MVVAAPIRPTASSGNDVTANRWATQLRSLGHDVYIFAVDEQADRIDTESAQQLGAADVLIAVHARRSARVVEWWLEHNADGRLVVALTGTDLYVDMPESAAAMAAVEAADGLIVLQQAAAARLERLRPGWAAKTRVVHQSVAPPLPVRRPVSGELRVIVLAHLREVKDPLLAARAAGRLAWSSAVTVHHAGRAFDAAWTDAATSEQAANPRYHWHGELDRDAALDLLATGHVMACTSLAEGGANVVTEAIAIGVPVIGTRIDGNTGLLGDDYPGLVPVGDDEALADLLVALERDPALLYELQRRTDALRPITEPSVERAALGAVIGGVRNGGS